MKKRELQAAFEAITPDEEQKGRMLCRVLGGIKAKRPVRSWAFGAAAACLALGLAAGCLLWPKGAEPVAFALSLSSQGQAVELLGEDGRRDPETPDAEMRYFNARNELEFYIEGKNIREIELSCESQFLYVLDWTETQQEKYWNWEAYHDVDPDGATHYRPERRYEKACRLSFPDGFTGYDQIWYRWTAYDLYRWALEDEAQRFRSANLDIGALSEEEKLKLAAGEGSAAGHIVLDGYPEEKLRDRITIRLTDRWGNVRVEHIDLEISSDALGRNVVSARLEK
ncbi:MAG: hypothetical protein LBU47_08395 [Christensenellaceae bacterium]|jgi:hypothetical protein|nr:hypothetical protein [Christensenellaceae bacterium]